MIKIKQEPFLPFPLRFAGVFLMIVGVVAIMIFGLYAYKGILMDLLHIGEINYFQVIGYPLLIVLGYVMLSARYKLIIDPQSKSYRQVLWILGFKKGEWVKFDYIQKVYINTATEGHKLSGFIGSAIKVKGQVNKAFIKLDNGETLHLFTEKDRKKAEKRLDKLKQRFDGIYKGK